MTESVPLRYGGAARIATLGELTGRDEFAVGDLTTASAIRLVDALLVRGPENTTEPIAAADLVAADRDRLLAVIYTRAFGDRIDSTVQCSRCGQPFDVDFSLRKLLESLDERASAPESEAVHFRLPTGRDELAVAGFPPGRAEQVLFDRCVIGTETAPTRAELEERLDEVAPLLDIELVARCPECSHVQQVEFDIQSYVLGSLVRERGRLIAEIHRLAAAYGWSLGEILSLTRSDRRKFVEMIENESVRR